MTAEPSQRPWRAEPSGRVGTDCLFDANGTYIGTVPMIDSALIVAAVNLHEHLIEHNKLNAEKVCELFEERDRLRDLVRRLTEYADAVTGYLPRTIEVLSSEHPAWTLDGAALFREARAAIGDEPK